MVFLPGRTTMNPTIQCAHCGNHFEPNPRVKNQRYCSEKECQRARKRKWQQEKLLNDPDYKANQRECRKDWLSRHQGYYREFRQRNGKSAERNRLLQKFRDSRRRRPSLLAKMDAFKTAPVKESGHYYLLPVLAKMDASAQKVILIPISCARRGCLQKRTR
jgi:hypothetical protein